MDEQTKPVVYEPFLEYKENYLIEQIYIEGKVKFITFDIRTEKTKILEQIETADSIIKPVDDDCIREGAIKLPSGIEEYGEIADLITDIKRHIFKYVDVSPKFITIASCYVLLSAVFDRFNTLPYLRFLGDTGTGKSRAKAVIGNILYKGFSASGCITRAVIYRMLKKWKGSLVLDEADFSRSDEYSEIVKILNCGFEKGSPVLRSVKDDPNQIEVLPVYSPKILVTRNEFGDRALEARCLTEIMSETNRDNIPSVLNAEYEKEADILRNKLLLFRLRNYKKINPDITELELDLSNVEPRLKQISVAFIALLKDEAKLLNDYKGFIKLHQRELIEKRSNTNEGQIVDAIFKLMGGINKGNGNPEDLALVNLSTNDDYLPIGSSDVAIKAGLNSTQVGKIIRNLGLNTRVVKVGKKPKRCIKYEKDKLLTLKRRYIPKA